MAKWYVVVSGATHELEWDELKQWAAMGRLNPTDPARSATEDGWRTVGQIPELVRMFPPRPPGSAAATGFQPPESQPPQASQPAWANPAQPTWRPVPPPEPKSSNRLVIVAVVVSFLVFAGSIGLVAFIVQMKKKNREQALMNGDGNATVVTATDRTCQITLPVGWKSVTGLNKEAILQARNEKDDLCLVILREEIPEDAIIDLERGSELMTDFFKKQHPEANVAGAVPIRMDGREAISRDISFMAENLKCRGLHIVTATDRQAFQLFLWSTERNFSRNNRFLREMPMTFRPVRDSDLDAGTAAVTIEVTGDAGQKLGRYRFLNDGRPISLNSSLKTLEGAKGTETVTVPKTALPLEMTVNGRKFRVTDKMLAETGCQWKTEGEITVPVFLSASSGIVERPPVNVKTRPPR